MAAEPGVKNAAARVAAVLVHGHLPAFENFSDDGGFSGFKQFGDITQESGIDTSDVDVANGSH